MEGACKAQVIPLFPVITRLLKKWWHNKEREMRVTSPMGRGFKSNPSFPIYYSLGPERI
jgi:hypothetical protein